VTFDTVAPLVAEPLVTDADLDAAAGTPRPTAMLITYDGCGCPR
jgi:hypothetical protein